VDEYRKFLDAMLSPQLCDQQARAGMLPSVVQACTRHSLQGLLMPKLMQPPPIPQEGPPSRGTSLFADSGWRRYLNRLVANELSAVAKYCDRVIQWLPREHDHGLLLANIQAPDKQVVEQADAFPDLTGEEAVRTAVLVNGTFNHHFDVQGLLMVLKTKLSRTSRVLVVLYNPYLSWLYRLANRLGVRKGEVPATFLTRIDLQNVARLSGFDIVRQRHVGYFPWRLLGLGDVVNRLFPLIPGVRWLGLTLVVVLRPIVKTLLASTSVSCIIPARNERGNIENALKRLPELGCPVEVIFVEGHSTDGTWEEIVRASQLYENRFRIHALRQPGKGKADAVRLGFAHATGSLLIILDADLTMPPEMLPRFLRAYCDGYADFIIGSRLVYPMQGEAMRFLNRLGNIFFAKALSWVLDVRISDSLCGTKMLTRCDYRRVLAWRREFGDFDPFGDFELIFPAAVLGLGIADIPVRYLARTYGETNIHRFRHGLLLLKMTCIGFFRIKVGTTPCCL
jgi:hypothetical protein